ncbi:MAG: GDP-mannose 4,6-dehydratase [Gracilimonas sp.]|uniref:NAD-dependent epimerase/dehydratase family protein n=1 Tax=Gracilimonas sp. TaxID=1974203 RepID=UPI001B2D0EC7|nr:NAD-dependent epimerase/dehydratase family protein [Gracilimonas sp.]MBO6587236.1 GDP-mannose 4,6-dehydratase [Gracilimonas sp.]MBO6614276.1 GDP-mannose 4,6-dehydratase [Gracilimonas sp.]
MKNSKKNIVVTGGAGFIGSHLIDRLLEEGHTVTNIDNFDPFYEESIKLENIKGHLEFDTYTLHEVDIRNKESLDKAIPNDADVIIHLAAKAGVRPSIADPIAYQEVNVAGTQNMLEVAREKEIKQFVFASSSSVYGKNPNVPWKEDDAVLQPISPYASTKVSGELLGHVYSHLYDIRFLALRFFTVYGPRQRPDLAIHKFLKLMSEEKEITLYGDGSTRRDYTYIDDIIDGVMAAVSYDGSQYEVINLGNNQTIELLELVEAIEKASGITAKKTFGPEQPGDVKQTWSDVNKAFKILKYNPNYNLANGLESFSKWFKKKIK